MHAMDILNVHSGSWWNAAQSGHGISVEVLDNETMVIYWFDYNPDGSPTFLITVADIDGDTATGNTFCYSGMKFGEFDPAFLKEEVWGTTSITFLGNLFEEAKILAFAKAYQDATEFDELHPPAFR